MSVTNCNQEKARFNTTSLLYEIKRISASTKYNNLYLNNRSFLSNCFKYIDNKLRDSEHNCYLENEIEEYLFQEKK